MQPDIQLFAGVAVGMFDKQHLQRTVVQPIGQTVFVQSVVHQLHAVIIAEVCLDKTGEEV